MDAFILHQIVYFILITGLSISAANRDNPFTALTDTIAIVFVVAGATLGLQ